MATAKQIEANRLNALLSTGPKTIEGKAAARRNALKHGLAGAGIVMPIDEEQLVQERAAELCSSLKPLHTFDLFLTEEVALEQLRAERCRRLERARRQRLAEDALERWDDDRIVAAEQLGAQLSNEPALYARLLPQTLQGCDWLLERWRGLGRALEGFGDWDDAQRRLALDLLGTPPELRRGGTPLDAAESSVISGQSNDPPEPDAEAARLRVVADEIERLTRLRDEVLEPRDEAEQRAAFHGEGVETDPELQLLHRYEAVCQRRKAWALKQLNKGYAPSRPASPGRGQDARASRIPPSQLAGEGRDGGFSEGPAGRDDPPPQPSPTRGEGAISHDSPRGYLDLNGSAHPVPPLFEPFLPPISGGAPTPREPQSASFSAWAGIGEGEAPAEPRHISQIINGSAGASPSRENGIDLSKEPKSAPSLPTLRSLHDLLAPPARSGNRRARRARGLT